MTSDQQRGGAHRLKEAVLWGLLVIGLVGTALQFWWWHTGYLEPLEFFIVPPAALAASFLLEMRWNVMLEGDENAA